MLLFVAAAVRLYINTNPPLEKETKKKIVEETNRARKIVIQFQASSKTVKDLLSQVTSNSDKHDRKSIERQLRFQFEIVLYQNNVTAEMRAPLAKMLARNSVDAVYVVKAEGGSIIVYFLCTTVKALFKFAQMITSGFLHEIFTEIIQSVTRTTVDVDTFVRAAEFNYRLLCLTSQQDRGW